MPCHQACFYDRELLLAHPFRTEYSVRADYEQFLWCFFTKQYMEDVLFCYSDTMIADYEGGGFSETKKNRKLSEKEHQAILADGKWELLASFMEEHGYEQTFRNEKFAVYR